MSTRGLSLPVLGMTMSLHRLTAGDGYDYLMRSVARLDASQSGPSSLNSYYSEKGEKPGTWIGNGLRDIEGLKAGDSVTSEQMLSLFGSGHHPLAGQRERELGENATEAEVLAAIRLGQPFQRSAEASNAFLVQMSKRIQEFNVEHGRPSRADVDPETAAQIRTDVANAMFRAEHDRAPANERELSTFLAEHSRPGNRTVAGFDLTFSPVKSISSLWALSDPKTAAIIEQAHDDAVRDALAFVEKSALFSRTGRNGVRTVPTSGLVGTAFKHRDSRAGDPDLHTHVAVANKVKILTEGKQWLSIDSRTLHKAAVTASEMYNTMIERRLAATLGVRFAPRDGDDLDRPVREIAGVPPELNQLWSKRRQRIEVRRGELSRNFRDERGRPPLPRESYDLAQRATLQTREVKHEPRSEVEQRAAWFDEAVSSLGEAAVCGIVKRALNPPPTADTHVTAAWIEETADSILASLVQRDPTWNENHARSEALRRLRATAIHPDHVEAALDLLVKETHDKSEVAATDDDGIQDPPASLRPDGESVYRAPASDLFTHTSVLESEELLLRTAGRTDGRRIDLGAVSRALAESRDRGLDLNNGQAGMVQAFATSGARLQLGIAAAGTGKTAAMRVLARAWESSGGSVIGLAPSAVAAFGLRAQTGAEAHTLAKLVAEIKVGGELARRIGPRTLLVVDEAGMAATADLAAIVRHATACGASVRMIGDDQQLRSVGAGGVLRDIEVTHGAVRLTEILRFKDPAEGAASLALRDGLPESMGYYFDLNRVHVGERVALLDQTFAGWRRDVESGMDSIMLAPTRALVSDLNDRARKSRLARAGGVAGPSVALADGNRASVGDTIITRQNARHIRASSDEWVMNGDRWVVDAIEPNGVRASHVREQASVLLPNRYVHDHVELGYASTVHTAQGVTVDTMHGFATGGESRQQFYTMMTRGRLSNDVYLVTVGDGAEHDLFRPETVIPPTASDVIAGILAHNDAPVSATTAIREAKDPQVRLGRAAERYVDALHQAALDVVGLQRVGEIEAEARVLVPGIEDEPAWPTLRGHLCLIEAQGVEAVAQLSDSLARHSLDGARDRAAILDWRLDVDRYRADGAGPLPWLQAVPQSLAEDPTWGPSLAQRSDQIQRLAEKVRSISAQAGRPVWLDGVPGLPAELVADLAVWRAACKVELADRRLTGPRVQEAGVAAYQRDLDARTGMANSAALAEWAPVLQRQGVRPDEFTPMLAQRLAAINRSGISARSLLEKVLAEGALPDKHSSAAIWWRISRHVNPTVATPAGDQDVHVEVPWTNSLAVAFGAEQAAAIESSRWWPTLVEQIDGASRRGWSVDQLLDAANCGLIEDADLAQAVSWRVAMLLDPPPDYDDDELSWVPEPVEDPLQSAARRRKSEVDFGPTDPMNARVLGRAFDWGFGPVTGSRIVEINGLASKFFRSQLPGSWADEYLVGRLGQDISADDRFRPGLAPAGWTNLVDHLRRRGVTDDELVAADLAKVSSRGDLIDRFRDRLVFPIIRNGRVLGFVGRRNPTAESPYAGPKYLNSAKTPAFSKGAQLLGVSDPEERNGSIPVLVEGPIDAIAITLATAGAYVGVAALGTALTDEQAQELCRFDKAPIVATDPDLAGRLAAQRDYWLLAHFGLDPLHARLPAGCDPADLLANGQLTALRAAIHDAKPLAHVLVEDRVFGIEGVAAKLEASAAVVAAQPPEHWASGAAIISELTSLPAGTVRSSIARAADEWTRDHEEVAGRQLHGMHDVRARWDSSAALTPADRWAPLADRLDPRITGEPDWVATAASIQALHESGEDVWRTLWAEVSASPLGDRPAYEVRLIIAGHVEAESVVSRSVNPSTSTRVTPSRDRGIAAPSR
jgi:conjugative relaxase-like TrwC/TraI family protein